ncbi:universal stress protein [Streptomyces gamaensis]|uniref:Universal stress protein n=1 Tax=Streptomyces gamaensis TaxID=1763542 RepID=A0ABW0YZ64_9ACTN
MSEQQQKTERIVVGVDGSDSSKEALRWALRQAGLTGATVDAVMAWQFPPYVGALGWLPPTGDFQPEEIARQVLTETVEEVVGTRPGARVRTVVEHGTAPDVLLRHARSAALLVVGSRGHGGFTEALLGSVGQHCVQHAPCPVVVVRGPHG